MSKTRVLFSSNGFGKKVVGIYRYPVPHLDSYVANMNRVQVRYHLSVVEMDEDEARMLEESEANNLVPTDSIAHANPSCGR